MAVTSFPEALPALSRLHWYVVERVLGQGGFGITYLAKDTNLDQAVAIKEYLPADVATRMSDATIRSRTEDLRDRYRWGLERFIQEARTLARFNHPNIVHVKSVFEFNNTAYMVMRFEKGMTLSALLDRRSTLPERDLQRILLPILDGLELVHNAGFIHRDIKPDNIHIDDEGNPVLLDFGSARQSVDSTHTLTILIAPGYAPFEQYYSDRTNQGPWTDIYALGATCYRAIAGRPPMDAVSRSKGVLGSAHEMMVSASVIGAGRYSAHFLAAVDHALEFAEKDRPQSIGEWRRELISGHSRPAPVTERSPAAPYPDAPTSVARDAADPKTRRASGDERRMTSEPPAQQRDAGEGRRASAVGPLLGALAGALIVAVGVGAYVAFTQRSEPVATTKQQWQETDRANAERVAKQKADLEAQTKAQDAPRTVEQPKNAEAAPATKPEIVAKSSPDEKRPRELAPVKPPAKAEAKTEPPAPKVVRSSPPATSPPIPSSPVPRDVPTASLPAPAPAQTVPSVPETAKPPPQRPSTEQIADADSAIAAKQYAEALAILKPLAEAGSAKAQFRLGNAYVEGQGVKRDYAVAATWYDKAARQGEIGAELKLAAMYASGNGVGRNDFRAYVWYGTAARLGSSAAKSELEKAAASLQPAEKKQADEQIDDYVTRISKLL